uniref:Uncharacterized protein n=1 Tax=Romanomermis culicivorax TaxID=13658 RepID=A0A915HDE5_ROMCU
MATYNRSLLHRGAVVVMGYRLCGAGVNADAMLLVASSCTITSGMVAVVVGKTVLLTHCWQCGQIEVDTWAMRRIGSSSSVTSSRRAGNWCGLG